MIELGSDEKLLAVERRHWLPIAIECASILLAAIVPVFFLIGAEFLPPDGTELVVKYDSLAWFLYAAWLFGLWMAFAVSITNYYLDVLVVTSKRVIDIEQIGLFSRDTAELHLDSIEDIHVEINGLVQSFFNYGKLHIQTSSENPEFSMVNIHDPHRVQEIISRARLIATGQAPS